LTPTPTPANTPTPNGTSKQYNIGLWGMLEN
jgi:hypothetical protein